MNDRHTSQLVEHFFRHEYGNLVSVLSRVFGFARIELIEDMVSSAMVQAMNSWKQNGVPENPSGWIHRVARNRVLDALRREKVHEKALALSGMLHQQQQSPDEWVGHLLANELPDSLLQMMFVCCHPILDRKSQIALTLNILCGFSSAEIGRGLLMTTEAAKKRVQRAKAKLAKEKIVVEFPSEDELHKRLSAVHDVLYLLFNEGYSTSSGMEPIKDEVCEEAARLCHLLCSHETLGSSESRALLSLMLFHASRLESRVDSLGNPVLLGDQDRTKWNRKLIDAAHRWLVKSVDEVPSRFHFEAVIAQYHCAANSLEETNWEKIIVFYNRLIELFPSPIYELNRAVAISESGDCATAIKQLTALRCHLNDYMLLDCALGHVYERSGNLTAATDAYLSALNATSAEHQKTLIRKRLSELQPR